MFTAIIYLSEQIVPFDANNLKELSEKAKKYNHIIDVTGFLSYKDGVFYQYLEGHQGKIKDLLQKIESDKRHRVYYKFSLSKVRKRIFNDWGMKYYIYNKRNHFDHDNLVRDILEVVRENTGLENRFEMELIENLKYIRKNLHKHFPNIK